VAVIPSNQGQRAFKTTVDRIAGTLMEGNIEKANNMDQLLGEEGQGRVRSKLC
jgi:hypothetical protein